MDLPSYIALPASARHIAPPPDVTHTGAARSSHARAFGPSSSSSASKAGLATSTFPPFASSASHAQSSSSSRLFNPLGGAGSISSNVSDLLLSSLLPPNLPKLPAGSGSASGSGSGSAGGPGGMTGNGAPAYGPDLLGHGSGSGLSGSAGLGGGGTGGSTDGRERVRRLTSQREPLGLPVMSNNFRRFMTKVGPVFWLQDRIEETLFWRKPTWTWAYILVWTFISFQPRILLLIPFISLLMLLLHRHEQSHPSVKSVLGGALAPAPPLGTVRLGNDAGANGVMAAVGTTTQGESTDLRHSGSYTTTTSTANGSDLNGGANGVGSEATDEILVPAVPPREAESGIDYYMNVQAIQNLMGLISDAYDEVVPVLTFITSPSSGTSTSFPLTMTHLMLLLLPPTLLLPLLPGYLLPYLLLAIGLAPPIFFHPNMNPLITSLPRHPAVRRLRTKLEDAALTDALPTRIGTADIRRVEVWENERLDPSVANKPVVGTTVSTASLMALTAPGSFSSKHLRGGERAPWVKVGLKPGETVNTPDGTVWLTAGEAVSETSGSSSSDQQNSKAKEVLALKEGWGFIPGEDWKVDVCALWSTVGSDPEGWVYMDDSWQNAAPAPITGADTGPTTGSNDGQPSLPSLPQRKVTRRRRWWRRVYKPVISADE